MMGSSYLVPCGKKGVESKLEVGTFRLQLLVVNDKLKNSTLIFFLLLMYINTPGVKF